MSDTSLKTSIQKGLMIITLDRPESRNSLTKKIIIDLGISLDRAASSDVRAVLITGSGDSFCSGADLSEFMLIVSDQGLDKLSSYVYELATLLHSEVIEKICLLRKPVVCGINGVAAGAGFSLSLACDVRICSESARFLMAYSNIGCTSDGGSSYLLPRLVGYAKAMELYFFNQPLSAQAALDIGLVNQVIPANSFGRHILETGLRLAEGPTEAFGRTKRLMNDSWNNSLREQLNEEAICISEIVKTKDFQNGVKAFLNKNKTWFTGE
jgi:2-(1,2-epoxy-1,2-dihydrophenyl)acetyl-CoA isomerase